MKKMNSVIALMGVGLMLVGTGIGTLGVNGNTDNVTAQAATLKGQYSRRTKWSLTPTHKYYKYKVRNKKAHTYTMTGPYNNIKLKTNHYLGNYTKNSWKRTKFTAVKHNGHWMIWYYVKSNAKNKAAGWVKLTDMRVYSPKPGYKNGSSLPDFDTWFKKANQSQRDYYAGHELAHEATEYDADGNMVPMDTMIY
ncbi:hypothetical protein [Levilactobacillus zymae]|uniref:hypothetical protein n=1 Tax=Levilactobacillus zymae TaxID=267363 RepID=UPI0028B40D5B|nr:hypothetical protein [Levilactobacillus zymae]MDT6980668.1 hypothetical protein [Levilactobacillus zymae]